MVSMHSSRNRVLWLLLAMVLLLVAVFARKRLTSAQFAGRVHHASAIDSKPRLKDVLSGRRPIKTVRLGELFSRDDSYLRFGSVAMEWSDGGDAGYLYFSATDTKRGEWEFAPCTRQNLIEVRPEDGLCEFYGRAHPKGTNIFGEGWGENAILVNQGQLLLAREANEPGIVYALKIKNRGRQSVQVECLEMSLPSRR